MLKEPANKNNQEDSNARFRQAHFAAVFRSDRRDLDCSDGRAAGAGAIGRHQLLRDLATASATAPISAVSPAPTITARRWRRRRAPAAKTWRAYLSTQAADGKPAVNARDRIGKGPWQNSKGVVVAKDVAELQAPPTI